MKQEYKLLVADSVGSLNKQVTDHLEQGWNLYGEPRIVAVGSGANGEVIQGSGTAAIPPAQGWATSHYYQAVYKMEEPPLASSLWECLGIGPKSAGKPEGQEKPDAASNS